MNDLDWEVTEVNKTCFFHLIQHADFGGTVYPNPWYLVRRWKTLPRCQSSGRTSNSNFTVRESFSTHSEPRSCLCDNPKIPSALSQTWDPLEADGCFCFPKKKTLHHETLFLKWYHSLAKSLPGKEKGNWIKNTSFLKFGVCFEVEDHHGTDNTINISMGEAGSWVSRCFKCWLRFTSAMLPTLVPRCPQSCWYTSWLVKKRGKGTRRTKLAKPKQTWFNDAKKKKGGVQNLQTSKSSGRLFDIPPRFPSHVRTKGPATGVCGWMAPYELKSYEKIQINSAVEGKKFLDWLVCLFN